MAPRKAVDNVRLADQYLRLRMGDVEGLISKAAVGDTTAFRHIYERHRSEVARLVYRLADKKRVVFVLHELEGVAPTDIAKIVGCPVLTVRTRLFYARRELEAMLAEEPSLASLQASFARASSAGGE